MKRGCLYILTIAIGFLALNSCQKDRYTDSPTDKITYSTDTLSFDTIFSSVGTSMRKIMLYNKHKKKIAIDRISIDKKSKFQIAIDGFSGQELNNIDFRAKDSLYIHVQVKIDPQNSNSPVLVHDSIAIAYNNRTDFIHLIAYGQDVFLIKNGNHIISQDSVLSNEKPYLIYDSLVVKKGAKLTIKEGCRFYFHNNAQLKINGQLIANGTLEHPIVMSGDRFDELFTNMSYDKLSAQWDGIYFGTESEENELHYTRIRNGIYTICIDSVRNNTSKHLTIKNCQIHNASQCCLYAVDATIEVGNSEITNGRNYCIFLVGGDAQFTQCTIANYYYEPHSSTSQSATMKSLYLNNLFLGKDIPVRNATFTNCILYGSNSEMLNTHDREVNFTNCFVKTKSAISNSNHVNEDPKFIIPYNDDHIFDFRISDQSPCIDQGIESTLTEYPTDIMGVVRQNKPDVGAHEFQP